MFAIKEHEKKSAREVAQPKRWLSKSTRVLQDTLGQLPTTTPAMSRSVNELAEASLGTGPTGGIFA